MSICSGSLVEVDRIAYPDDIVGAVTSSKGLVWAILRSDTRSCSIKNDTTYRSSSIDSPEVTAFHNPLPVVPLLFASPLTTGSFLTISRKGHALEPSR